MASVPSAPQAPELITHSSSTCASTCLRRYFYRYELGLVPSEEKEATHRGSLFHAALEMRDHGATDEAIAAHVRAHALALLGAIVIAGVLVYPSLSHAQTTRVVLQRDSVLLIATLPRCTTACPDSVHLAWTYGAQRIAHIVKPKAIDTVRMARRPVLSMGTGAWHMQ